MELMNLSYLIKEYEYQSPIVVVRNPNKKKYEVVAGKRRLLACILAGLDTVRCRIIRSEEYRALMADKKMFCRCAKRLFMWNKIPIPFVIVFISFTS